MAIDDLLRKKGYETLHRLGEGSGGQVFKALQLSTGQVVAVKVLSLVDLGGEVRARRLTRFRREISLCSQLYHPDIVRLLDSGELDENRHFAVFEFIPGATLAEVLSETRVLNVQRTQSLMLQLLAPLAYAHARGIFHRDLKPNNIMVMTDGTRDRVKILDFGISIAAGADLEDVARLTLSQEWVGTPAYAAPEQLSGAPGDAKSDLYAWALVFVECLTGIPVVRGQSLADVIRRHLTPEPHELPGPLLENRLGMLLASVLEKNPERRLGDAATVLSMLETIPIAALEDANGYLIERIPELHAGEESSSSDTLTDGPLPARVETRHATVVACRVFFGGESTGTEIEQLDTALEDANAVVRDLMTQFGANVAESFGEFSIVYFGLSRASDAVARLALRASLEVSARLERTGSWLGGRLNLRVQIGIHNGPVTLQRREGSRRRIDGVTSGVAMQLAALEIQAHAESASILLTDDFRALVERHAQLEPLPEQAQLPVAWRREPIKIHRLITAPDYAKRRLHDGSLFFGRRSELETLRAAWERSREVDGAVVVLRGEAGIGKSRLAAELGVIVRGAGAAWLETRCLPEWQRGFLRPLASLFRSVLGITTLEGIEAARELERHVDKFGLRDREAVQLLCDWLLLPTPPGHAPIAWSPQKRRAMLHELLAEVLVLHMERGSVVLIEDLHWADPSTLDYLETLVRRVRERPAFLLLTTRPGLEFSFASGAAELQLGGLELEATAELVHALAPDLEPRVAARLAERCDGVPLYAEALALAHVTRLGATDAGSVDRRAAALDASAVPPSLRDLLTSRLDEVGGAKQIAEFAAALGREFSLELLAGVVGEQELDLVGDLEQLVSAKILFKQLEDGKPLYAFRHALIRDAAYDGTPAANRRRTHVRIAEGLEHGFARLVEAQPDTLAHHWEHGGHADRALRYLLLAAQKSAIASAHDETIAALDHGLTLIAQVSSPDDRARYEAELMLAKGAAIVGKRGYTDPEAALSFERVATLVPAQGETIELAFAARWGLWYFHNTQANLKRSASLADELDAIARQAADETLALNAYHALCLTNFSLGRLEEAILASHRTREIYDFERHKNLCIVRGDDPHLACLSWGAISDLFRGRPEEAAARTDEALAFSQKLGYPSLRAGVHANAAWMYLIWGTSGAASPELEPSRKHARIASQLASEFGFPFWDLYSRTIDNAARAALGELQAAEDLRRGVHVWRGAGAELGLCFHFAFAGDALRRAGRYDDALTVLGEGLEHCDKHNSRFFEAELHRLRAEVFIDFKNPNRDPAAGRLECMKAKASAAPCRSDWWTLATNVTLNRSPELSTEAERAELRATLSLFQSRSLEPPLLREARTLAAAHAIQ